MDIIEDHVIHIEDSEDEDCIMNQLQSTHEDSYIYYADKSLGEIVDTYMENGYDLVTFIEYLKTQYNGFSIYFSEKYDMHFLVSAIEFSFDN